MNSCYRYRSEIRFITVISSIDSASFGINIQAKHLFLIYEQMSIIYYLWISFPKCTNSKFDLVFLMHTYIWCFACLISAVFISLNMQVMKVWGEEACEITWVHFWWAKASIWEIHLRYSMYISYKNWGVGWFLHLSTLISCSACTYCVLIVVINN